MTTLALKRACWAGGTAGAMLAWGCGSADDGPDTPANDFGTGGMAGAIATGTGGFGQPPFGAGGTTVGTGGFAPGTGGVIPAAGGSFPATGGAFPTSGGAPGTGGAGGAPPATGGAGGAEPDNRPPCMTKPSQVISMGDSYMNWATHTFPADLNAAAGVTFRPTYAVGGFSMGSGGIGLIPTQFDTALAQDRDIIAVVLDGGGNDLLIPALGRPDCKNLRDANTNPGCQQIVTDGIAASTALMNKMADAGVHDVIYFFYPHVPAPTALGGSYPNVMLDYALPLVKEACDSAVSRSGGRLSCWFVDTIPIFAGHDDWFAPADIHENSLGSRAIAEAVVATMKAHCIAQPVESGCCRP